MGIFPHWPARLWLVSAPPEERAELEEEKLAELEGKVRAACGCRDLARQEEGPGCCIGLGSWRGKGAGNTSSAWQADVDCTLFITCIGVYKQVP